MWPGACLGGKVALVGGLQTSAVGCPVECVAAVAQALEAAGGVDADVVAGPLEGALVSVCAAQGTRGGRNFRLRWTGTACHSVTRCASVHRQSLGRGLSAQLMGKCQTSCRHLIFHFISIKLMFLGHKPPHIFAGCGQGRNVYRNTRGHHEPLPFQFLTSKCD